MENFTNIPTVVHVIQLALTPVFLLGGVAAVISILTGRLARAVDRFRYLHESVVEQTEIQRLEVLSLKNRVQLTQKAIGMCSICALLVCVSIITLFLGAELELNLSRVISVLFIAAILALTAGLLLFLREISLATEIIT